MPIKYNIFKDAHSIRNINTCLYDATSGYITDFSINGNVSGWDIYYNICLYGSWNGVLFGTALDNTCYIGRTIPILSLAAEHYYMFKLTMKLTIPDHVKHRPTKFRIMWQTVSDTSWTIDKSIDIDLNLSNKWYTYIVTLGESSSWIGDIFNIRLYPFIDGRMDMQFAIKHIEIFSSSVYKCINTNCSHYEVFKHPCPYIGDRASVTAGIGQDRYVLISEESDTLLVNIDGYGDECIKLGTVNLSGYEMSKFLQECINKISIGQYVYAEVDYNDETKKLSITSGASAPIVAYNPSGRLNDELLIFDKVGSYTYTIPNYVKSVDLLIIAGGGGGGDNAGGAGGAGGYIEINNYTAFKCGDVLSIVVGSGGLGASVLNNYRYNGANGQNSSVNTWVAVGGGGGSASGSSTSTNYGIAGGSGGGGGVYYPGYKGDGGKGVEGQGNNGSSVFNNTGSSVWVSGGGGGAGGSAPDVTITSAVHRGDVGGVGKASSITGKSVLRATGGAGWTYGTTSVVVHAQSGTGDGGGGNGGNGGSGVVIVRVNYDFTNYSDIKIGGTAATVLGFFDNNGKDVSIYKQGNSSATGFDYYSSHRLTSTELNSLIDSKIDKIAYIHKPNQYTVEAGRRDYAYSLSSTHSANSLNLDYYKLLEGDNKLIIDASHPVSDCGRLNKVIVNGMLCEGGSKVVLIRPLKNTIGKVITSIDIPVLKATDNATANHTTSSVDVDWQVLKGDMIGFYNFNVLCPFSLHQQAPNAVYFEIIGLPFGEFDLGASKAQGIVGISFYARSNRLQRNITLDIDLGKRLNIDKVWIKGIEKATLFEYNVAACLDMSWRVELFNETHWHVVYCSNTHFRVEHRNLAYGIECLNDCIRTAENGIAGESVSTSAIGSTRLEGGIYISNSDVDTNSGLRTFGKHSYCYVNGDAEWLSKEFPYYDCSGSIPSDYEYDPIAYFLIFPYKRKLKVHKTGMYFKDAHNFKELSLSYYTGEQEVGDSNLSNFKYIPSFNTVIVDGITYLATKRDIDVLGHQFIKIYFSNPWPSCKLNFVNGIATNSDIYQTVMNKGMNVIEHEFNPIECFGFAFQTTFHKSTKLTELEVYSSMDIESSLVDNVFLSASVYGDYWTNLVFEDIDTDMIKTTLTGSPRYFKIEINSQDIFFLYEMWAEISLEHIKSLGCETSLIMVDAKGGGWLPSKVVEIENQYNRPLDLYVTLLRSLNTSKNVLWWSKCNSLETILNAEIGPGGILRKEIDYPLFLACGQVANNTQSYYLQNLIHEAKAYHQINGGEWKFYKFLAAGGDINYSNQPNVKSYTIKFDSVSSKYWKIGVKDLKRHNIYSIKSFNQYLIPVEIQNIYIQTAKDHYSSKYKTSLDRHGVIQPLVIFDKLFNENITEGWVSNNSSESTLFSYTEGLQPFLNPFSEVFIKKEFLPGLISFDLEITFKFKFPNELNFRIELLNASDEILLVCEFIGFINYTCTVNLYTYITPTQEVMASVGGDLNYWVFHTTTLSDVKLSEFKFTLKKVGNELKYINITTLDGVTAIFTGINKLSFPDRFSSLIFRYTNNGDRLYNNSYDLVSIYSLKLTSPVVLSNLENIIIEFKGSQVLSAIEVTKDVSELTFPVVYVSYDDNNDYIGWARNFIQSDSIVEKHTKITSSHICYRIDYTTTGQGYTVYPWSCINSDRAIYALVNYVDLSSFYDFWYCYDFGKGNECCVRSAFISFDNMIQYTNDYKVGRIYGTNTNFNKFNPNSLVNILLAEFDIVYTNQSPYSNTITFNNTNFFRFLVVYIPAIDNKPHRINIRDFRVYESYILENSDPNCLVFKEDFNGFYDVDYNIWEIRLLGYCTISSIYGLSLINYPGDTYSSQSCYLREAFILKNNSKYIITCKWLPSKSSIYNTSEGPYIGIGGLNSSRVDATLSTSFIKILLSQTGVSLGDNQRTAIRVSQQSSEASSTIGTVVGTMFIDINESIWHDLKIILDFGLCSVTVILDYIFELKVVVSRLVVSSIGDKWRLEFGNRGYGDSKNNIERFREVCVYSNFIHPNSIKQEVTVQTERNQLVYTIPANSVGTNLVDYKISISLLKSLYGLVEGLCYNKIIEVGIGKQFSSVKAAVESASVGTMVLIYPGTYYESQSITITKQIHLIGSTKICTDVVLACTSRTYTTLNIDITDDAYILKPKVILCGLTLRNEESWGNCLGSYGSLFDREIYNCYIQATAYQYPLLITNSTTILYNCMIDLGYNTVKHFTSGYLAFFKCVVKSAVTYTQSSKIASVTDTSVLAAYGYGPFFYDAYSKISPIFSVWDDSYNELITYYREDETKIYLDIIVPYIFKDKDNSFIIILGNFIQNKVYYSNNLNGDFGLNYSIISCKVPEKVIAFMVKYNQNISVKESLYYNYLVIDLGQHHNIEFIRQYGDRTNLIDLFTATGKVMDFSASDTTDVSLVNWTENKPVLLCHFDTFNDYSIYNHTIVVVDSVTIKNINSAITPNGHVAFTGGHLKVLNSALFNLFTNSFTLEFRLKRNKLGEEGIIYKGSQIASDSTFEFYIDKDNFIHCLFYVGALYYSVKSVKPLLTDVWYHVVVIRTEIALILYLDGRFQNGAEIDNTVRINITNYDIIIGRTVWLSSTIELDELRFINGYAVWLYNFVVPALQYTVDTVGDKTFARWLKIPFLCGDGITRNVQYIGIYPDIRYPYIKSGGVNCKWISVGTLLSNYELTDKNLSVIADIVNVEQTYYDYSNDILKDWSNLTSEVSDAIIVRQSNFLNYLDSTFWSSVDNLFNDSESVIVYNKGLRIYLAKTESGHCDFFSHIYYNDCSFEIHLTHPYIDVISGLLITELQVYSVLKNNIYFSIIREFGSNDSRLYVRSSSGNSNNTIFDRYTIYNISRLRITKIGVDVQAFWYDKSSNVWKSLVTMRLTDFELGGVVFRLHIQKTMDFCSTNIDINYIRIIDDFTNISTKIITHSSIVSDVIDNTEVKCYNCKSDYLLVNGGLLSPDILLSNRSIDSIEFKYNTLIHAGGVSLIDSLGTEILGIANFASILAFNTLSGWILSEFMLSLNNWYQFKIVFDWINYDCIISIEDMVTNEVKTFSVSLIIKKIPLKLRVNSTFGNGWGSNYIDIKLTNIIIKTQANSMYGWSAINCLSDDVLNEGFDYCWGFPATDKIPTLILDLGTEYYINEFIFYHTVKVGDTTWLNTDYTVYSATTVSGTNQILSYSPILVVTNNTKEVVTHTLNTSILTRIIKLEIIKYNKPSAAPTYIKTNRGVEETMIINGGFLRKFIILSAGGGSKLSASKYSVDYLNSEEHPIFCMNLGARFNITGHTIKGQEVNKPGWDNDECFYQYSNDISNDPTKVAFSELSGYKYVISYYDTYLNTEYTTYPYTLLEELFITSGYYSISWYYYGSEYDNAIELSLNGGQSISFYSTGVTSSAMSWEQQVSSFNIENSGYYTMSVRNTLTTVNYHWGVKEVIIKSNNVTSKWIALRRNTATNFDWEPDVVNRVNVLAGVHFINKLQVFVSDRLRPTEYYWWWVSNKSVLYYDSYNTKVGRRSLKIMYPNSLITDTIFYLPGDSFGQDKCFSIKDLLSCWLYVEDINRLDTTIGGIVFGNFEAYSDDINRGDQAYYSWSFSTMGLRTGWNSLELPFDKASIGIPLPNNTYSKFNTSLNFKIGCTSSFGIVFKGKGLEFYMLLDGIMIKRNTFNDTVLRDEKGLCLTGKEYLEVPLSGVNLCMGTIEMWVKLYTTTEGKDHFGNHNSRTLFTIVNNNESLSLSIRSYAWFEIGFGDIKSAYKTLYPNPNIYDVSNLFMGIDDVVHLAVVWDNEGNTIGNRDTIRLYVNNDLILSTKDTWPVTDFKSSLLRFGGGNTYLANNDDCTGSAIFSNIKYYNFCKTDFDLSNLTPSENVVNEPNNFIAISKDNINFYNTISTQLPLVYENIQPAEKIKIYYKLNKSNMNIINGLTGNIAIDWHIPV